jgi:hypothetical protein
MTDISPSIIEFNGSELSHSILSTNDMLEKQKNIIKALFYIPLTLTKYIHYRGSEPVEFRGLPIPVPPIPIIPYNDPNICCILDKIVGSQSINGSCNTLSVNALGPRGKIGVPYKIKSEDGIELIVKISKIDKLYSNFNTKPPTSIAPIDSRERYHCISNIKFSKIRYIASDEFTNETLIAYALNYVALQASLPPLFVRHYQGAICSNSETKETYGLNIMENCDLGHLDKLQENPYYNKDEREYQINDIGRNIIGYLVDADIIFQILTQLTIGLYILQSYTGFVSGDLKAGNVFIKSDPIDTEYMGIKLKASFTCKIADYGKSSCMLPLLNGTSIRFYNDSTLANVYLKIHPFEPDISKSDGEYYYTIGNLLVSQIYTRTRHMGIPFYRSFDYYTVLVSMLTHPAFYYMFFANGKLRSVFWDPIWVNDSLLNEGEEVMKRIHQYVIESKGQRISDAITMLKGLRLKCGAIRLVIKQLKETAIP